MKLTLKKLALASLLSISSVSAFATDIITNLNTLTLPTQTPYSNTHAAGESSFFDDFIFTIPTGSASSVTTSVAFGNFFGIDNIFARIYSGNTHETGAIAPGTLAAAWGTAVNMPGGVTLTSVSLNPTNLVAGTYTLQISGRVIGGSGGSYSGLLTITPVPEADTYAMLVAGLGLIGGIARRKTNV